MAAILSKGRWVKGTNFDSYIAASVKRFEGCHLAHEGKMNSMIFNLNLQSDH